MEQLVSLVLLAGELLLTSGAEMSRVEETMERMGLKAGFLQVEGFASPTGLFISLHSPDGRVYTRVRRIRKVNNNLATIAEINALSRSFSAGEISVAKIEEDLKRLKKAKNPSSLKGQIIGGGGALAFTLMYGGTWLEGLISGVLGTIVLIIISWLDDHPVPQVLQAATGAMVAAGLAMALTQFSAFNSNVVTLGAVMVLAPGVVMTTAIRDMLSGELVSGVTRGAEALAIAVAIATGVAVVLSIGGH